MSASLLLVPLAVAVVSTAVGSVAEIVNACESAKEGKSNRIQTKFNNKELLKKTLIEHGISVQEKSPDCMIANLDNGKIIYERMESEQPYTMQIFDVENMDDLISNIKEIENEDGSNVQSYTYQRVKRNLPSDMYVKSEEIMEDDAIWLTLIVD